MGEVKEEAVAECGSQFCILRPQSTVNGFGERIERIFATRHLSKQRGKPFSALKKQILEKLEQDEPSQSVQSAPKNPLTAHVLYLPLISAKLWFTPATRTGVKLFIVD